MADAGLNETVKTRRVRPWVAALLTFVAWGLGFYYAHQPKTAVRLAIASVIVGVGLAALMIGVLLTRAAPLVLDWIEPAKDWIGVVAAAPLAVWAWVATARQPSAPKARPVRLLGYLAIWLVPLFTSLSLAMVVRFGVVQPFRFPSGSMQPTIAVGDYLLVSKSAYGYSRFSFSPFRVGPPGRFLAKPPQRGDLVAFRPVTSEGKDFVKRLVGMPGDTIQIVDGVLTINGVGVEREALGTLRIIEHDGTDVELDAHRETLPNGVTYTTLDRGETQGDHTAAYKVPADHYWMLGDDRDNSSDSRFEMGGFGYVPFDHLVGKVVTISKRRPAPSQ